MVKIRVTRGGCGIEYTDEHGNARHALKTADDGPFLCDAKQAERLVGLGVAAYVTTKEPDKTGTANSDQEPDKTRTANSDQEPDKTRTANSDQEPGANLDAQTGHLSAEDLEKWDFNDLRKLAADIGLKPEGKKKVDYIAAIVAAEVTAGDDEAENGGEGTGDDELPELGAVDPE